MKISIPKPCHENWNEMLPELPNGQAEDKGRFCLKCTKTVVDFSNQSKDQIKSFFKESTGKICGRFSIEQVETPKIMSFAILKKRMTKFAMALYLVFGSFLFSCGNTKTDFVKGDVAQVETVLQGKVMVSDTTTTKPKTEKVKKKKSSKKACKKNTMIQGDVLFVDTTYIEKRMGEVIIEN